MPAPQQESSQDHLIAPRIYIFLPFLLLSCSLSHLLQEASTISSFLWSPTQWCFTLLSAPPFWLGHLFFAHVPSSKFMSLTPLIYLLQLLPSHLCTPACTWEHLFRPCWCQFKFEWITWNYVSFLSIWCHSLLCYCSCAMSFPYLLQWHPLFSVSKISSNSQTCCFFPMP